MLDLLAGFVRELRAAGLPVSLTENLDAMEALRHIPLEDREAFKAALGASLVKNWAHWGAFETVFEVYFSLRPVEGVAGGEGQESGELTSEELEPAPSVGGEAGADTSPLTDQELRRLIELALSEGDEKLTEVLARVAVTRYAGMEPGRPVGGAYYLYRTLRSLNFDTLLDRLLAAPQLEGSELSSLDERLRRDELRARVEQLRHQVETEIRRRLVADRGAEAMAKTLRKPLPEDVDFMHANREEMQALGKAIAPLARKLAVRLARKRRHGRRGALDFRNTIRHSLSYGGVPAEPKFRHPHPKKPEIMVVADISGSVAAFARFTLQFVHAISSQFSQVRSFVFVDGIDEVTRHFEGADDVGEAVQKVNTEADVVWADGHSDYGHALSSFWERWGKEVNAKTSVIILGDARNNYHAAEARVVAELAHQARHLYWLNPEPRSYWDTGDSIISEYATHCDGVFECRSLRQLESFVEHIG